MKRVMLTSERLQYIGEAVAIEGSLAVCASTISAEVVSSGEFGWAGEEQAAADWEAHKATIPKFDLFSDGAEETLRVMLYEDVRAVFGHDTPNYPQQVGSCVGFGKKNAQEHRQCVEIVQGDREEFHLLYEPFDYGTARREANMSGGDGCTGSGAAAAAQKWGMLRADTEGLPAYSGSQDRRWGNRPWVPEQYTKMGSEHTLNAVARIDDEAGLRKAMLVDRCPVTIASNYGYSMQASSDGFHRPGPQWGHQMCIIGLDLEDAIPHGIILNSWGDVHGRLKDRKTGADLPVGVLRVKLLHLMRHITNGEAFAYGGCRGFVPAKAPDFSLW